MEMNKEEALKNVVLIRGNKEIASLKDFFAFLNDFMLTDLICALQRRGFTEPSVDKIQASIFVDMGNSEFLLYNLTIRESLSTRGLTVAETIFSYRSDEQPQTVALKTGDTLFLSSDGIEWEGAGTMSEYQSIFVGTPSKGELPKSVTELGAYFLSYFPFDFDCTSWASSLSYGDPTPMLTRDGSNIARVAAYWRQTERKSYDKIAGYVKNHYVFSKQVESNAWELAFSAFASGNGFLSNSVTIINVIKSDVTSFAMRLLLMHAELYGNIFIHFPDKHQTQAETESYLRELKSIVDTELADKDVQIWIFTQNKYLFRDESHKISAITLT